MCPVLSYRDAVALLDGTSTFTAVLDKGSSLLLFGMGGVDLFDVRARAVGLCDELIRGLRDRVKGLSRYDRTRRLAAAHAVIVFSAYLEALGEVNVLPELTREDQERLTGLETGKLTEGVIGMPVPMPTPQHPYEDVLHDLTAHYTVITKAVVSFLSGLACWDSWDETTRDRLVGDIPARALRRYEELFRRLATDFPEVACWSDLVGHQATRAEVRNLSRGLADLQERLSAVVSQRGPSDRLKALVHANRAALGQPIVTSADTPRGMTIPLLDQGYVDPGFRLLPPLHGRHVASEESWRQVPRRDDLGAFLAGYLTLPQAVDAPLVVLGQPGAGKSVLTRILAARLPAAEFLPLRVELRGVPAESDVLAQIEHGIKDALDEAMSWPDLVHAAQGALPVIMLDGFDELLQATGVNQTDYLERVAQFQRRQAQRGRALAVIVTSRTAVADRARVPHASIVLRLEPFDEDQMRQWVDVWNRANHAYFQQHALQPLAVANVLTVPRLAEQPLLLLMLALYDADTNALRLMREELHKAELYERLLLGFAAREVRKSGDGLADADLSRAVEDVLLRLEIAAFAMFNRGLQWVRDTDLDADLRVLLPSAEPTRPHGFRRALTRAEGVIGSFFFVHASQALRDEERLKTYEFLHPTFGEYLVARLVVRELADLAEELAFADSRNRRTKPDEAFLYALLSFAALTVRAPIVGFLEYGVRHRMEAHRRALLRRHLCELFAGSLMPRRESVYDAYEPVVTEAPARCAAYGVNLLLLAVLCSEDPISGTDLFRTARPEAANELWRRVSRLWHAQLSRAEWGALVQTLRVRHLLRDDTRMMMVGLDQGEDFDTTDLVIVAWPARFAKVHLFERRLPADRGLSGWAREISFRDDAALGHLLLLLLLGSGGSEDLEEQLAAVPRKSVVWKPKDEPRPRAVADVRRPAVGPGDRES